jgi:hypothetical protein
MSCQLYTTAFRRTKSAPRIPNRIALKYIVPSHGVALNLFKENLPLRLLSNLCSFVRFSIGHYSHIADFHISIDKERNKEWNTSKA